MTAKTVSFRLAVNGTSFFVGYDTEGNLFKEGDIILTGELLECGNAYEGGDVFFLPEGNNLGDMRYLIRLVGFTKEFLAEGEPLHFYATEMSDCWHATRPEGSCEGKFDVLEGIASETVSSLPESVVSEDELQAIMDEVQLAAMMGTKEEYPVPVEGAW
jgi:hypothetical protein